MAATPFAIPSAERSARSSRVRIPTSAKRPRSTLRSRWGSSEDVWLAYMLGAGLAVFVDDPAISQGNPPGEAVCDLAIMGDHHDRRSGNVQILQQAENRLAVLRVEVPRWLVGEDSRRNPHQSTSDRDPLALATGELGREGDPR